MAKNFAGPSVTQMANYLCKSFFLRPKA